MDITFIISAAILTLLAIVVATSLLNRSSSSNTVDFANARRYFGANGSAVAGGLDETGPRHNGHIGLPDINNKKKRHDSNRDWCEISGSAHDHWDVVKSVQSVESHPHLHSEEPLSSSMSMSLDSSSDGSLGRGRSSFIGLSDKDLLKFAFSHPQTEGATESPGINDNAFSDENDSLKYVPGKARSHHLQTMMSKEELEEEQRVQREQLSAIFKLLKDNQETFGEVSEGEMEEQLKLYSI